MNLTRFMKINASKNKWVFAFCLICIILCGAYINISSRYEKTKKIVTRLEADISEFAATDSIISKLVGEKLPVAINNFTRGENSESRIADSVLYSLYYFFTTQGCHACIEKELKMLNDFQDSIQHTPIGMLGLCRSISPAELAVYKKYYHIKFPVELDNHGNLYSSLSLPREDIPSLFVLVDKNNHIVSLCIFNKDDPERTVKYLKRILHLPK